MVRGLLGKLASRALSVAGKWQHQQLRRLNIHEYQGAELMGKYGINVPRGAAAGSVLQQKLTVILYVSGRLFNQSSDSVPRRSARLSRDTTLNSNSNTSQFGGNGTDHSSGKLRVNSSTSSKLCSTAVRSVQVRKGKPRTAEIFVEGGRYEAVDEMCTDNIAASSVSIADGRCFEQDKAEQILSQDSKLAIGIRELLGLLRTLGEGYRLSCLFKSQEALEVYRKLPEPQFNTGWVLCQVQPMHYGWRFPYMLLILGSKMIVVKRAVMRKTLYNHILHCPGDMLRRVDSAEGKIMHGPDYIKIYPCNFVMGRTHPWE